MVHPSPFDATRRMAIGRFRLWFGRRMVGESHCVLEVSNQQYALMPQTRVDTQGLLTVQRHSPGPRGVLSDSIYIQRLTAA